ncbi:hypothetical protein [Rhizobium sp. X9]|uniref:hypothetical protein n=1 Tax=Rhizobium sp. X9 TaxID=2815360 RepID=UPI001C0CA0ED|nr:hypothetical protein [Rhizobium sp. X9]
MSADLRTEQRNQTDAGDQMVAARRLHDLLVGKDDLERLPSIEECREIVDLLVAHYKQA